LSITRSSARRSASRAIASIRLLVVGAAAAGLASSLAGCGAMMPETGSYRTTVPEAIENSDLDVLRATTSTEIDGFGRTVNVHVDLERDEVTTAEIEEVLRLITGKIDQPGASRVELSFMDWRTIESIDSEAACEAIGSPSIRCTYNSTIIDLDDLQQEFGA
jgi:hypothetical protein